MNLLIVDDDEHVILGIMKNLNWEKLPISQVFSALGVPAAKKTLQNQEIDILICDIEMPQETGLDLLQWIRDQNMKLQAIFLTSYARFEYARRAIQLESTEYILKPVDYGQLQQAVALAIDKVMLCRQSQVLERQGQYWVNSRRNLTEYFWTEVIAGTVSTIEEMDRRIAECGLDYIQNMVFLPILLQSPKVQVHETHTRPGQAGEGEGWYTKKDGLISEEAVICDDEYGLIILLKSPINADIQRLGLETDEWVGRYLEDMKALSGTVSCGVGMWSTINLVNDDVKAVREMLYDSPKSPVQVLSLHKYEPVRLQYEMPDLERWGELIKKGYFEQLESEVRGYLDRLEGHQKLSARTLQKLGLDLTQLVYSYLSSMNIYVHMLFENEENNLFYSRAALSSELMMHYFHYLLSKSADCKKMVEQPQSIVGIIKQFMDQHFQENISRDDLSRLVFLNADYLSRLFKKEVGFSISSYLIYKRIELAKELLISSKKPVSVIASQTGYDNFAYFTKIFKEKTGFSPNEYRKKYLKHEERLY